MMKRILASIILITTLFTVNAQVINTHPRIFLDPTIITNLQTRATNNTVEWQEVQTRLAAVSSLSAVQIMDIVYEGHHYAYYYALDYYATGNTASRDSAVQIFEEYFYNYTTDSSMYWDSGYESRSTMADVATLYDWLYNHMSAQFRNDVRARLILWADWILYEPGIYGQFGSIYYFEGNNYCIGHLLGITSVAYAIHSEDALHGDRYIEVSDSVLPLMINFANTRLNNGDANEGWGYGAGYAVNYFKTLAIVKTATIAHTDLFNSTTYDEGVAKFLPFASLPNLTHMLAEGDWARESTGEIWDLHRLTADLISTYSNDITSQRVSRFWANETVPLSTFDVTSYRWMPFLFSNQEITPLDYRTVAPYTDNYYYTDTIGTDQFIQRTGWEENSQWVSYRGGGRYGDHAHNGVGHFSLFENGWLLIDKNIQSASGINGMDSMHNCVQIESMNNIEMYPFGDYVLAEHVFEKRMEILPDYSYFWSDLSPVYLARETYNMGELNVVTQNERQFFYLPDLKKMAIFDLVETELASHDKAFATHFWDTPTLGAGSDHTYYSNDSTTVYVTTCYPTNHSINIVDNTSLVSNTVQQPKDEFMHLVHTQKTGTPKIDIVALSPDANNVDYADFYGSFHEENASDNYVILFNGNDPTYLFDSVAYTVPVTTPQLKNYIVGVEPLGDYYGRYELLPGAIRVILYEDYVPGTVTHHASPGGVIYFELGPLPVSVEENNSIYANIFYNYGNSSIEIKTTEEMGRTEFSLMDMQGKYILHEIQQITGNQYSIPVGPLSNGIYVLNLQTEKGITNKKILIAR